MDALDSVIEEVARAVYEAQGFDRGFDGLTPMGQAYWLKFAHTALSVPSVSEALDRDVRMREIVGEHFGNDADAVRGFDAIAAAYMDPTGEVDR